LPPYLGPEFFVAALCDTHVFKLRDALLQFAGGSQCRGNLHWDKEVASQDIGVQEAEGRLRMELLCGHPSIRFARTQAVAERLPAVAVCAFAGWHLLHGTDLKPLRLSNQ